MRICSLVDVLNPQMDEKHRAYVVIRLSSWIAERGQKVALALLERLQHRSVVGEVAWAIASQLERHVGGVSRKINPVEDGQTLRPDLLFFW